MKYIMVLLLPLALFSCRQSSNTEEASNRISSLAPLGGDEDNHGCLTSAGYTWSKVKEECIRPWEGTITLNITDTSDNFETAAFALVDLDKQKAELFLKEEEESVLLDSVAPHLYANKQYKLIEEDHCWSLVHHDEVLYEEKK